MKVRIALVGCGRIFEKHFQAIEKLSHQFELVGIADSSPTALEEKSKKCPNVPTFLNYQEMIKELHPDVISILTPSGLHAEHTLVAAKHKCNVIVEKPMALRLSDADEMIRECDRNGVRLFVVKQNRFNESVQKLRKTFEEGRFGKISLLTSRVRWCRTQSYYNSASWRGTWALDGGVLANQAAHHVDLLQWFGGPIVSVYAKANTFGVKIETEDTAVGTIQFASGALGSIEATTAVRPTNLEGSLSVLGEKGSVVIGGSAVNQIDTWNFIDSSKDEFAEIQSYSTQVENVYGNGHLAYYEHVANCLQTQTGVLVDGFEGKKSLELINAFYESIESQKEVFLGPYGQKSRLGRT